jgi:hypothetical protein
MNLLESPQDNRVRILDKESIVCDYRKCVDWAFRNSVTGQFFVGFCTGFKHGQCGFGIKRNQDWACVNNAPIAPFSICGIGPGGFTILCINAPEIVLAGQAVDMAVL